jgi:hypothetical protein
MGERQKGGYPAPRSVLSRANVEQVWDALERRRSPSGSPFLRVTFDNGTVLDMTTNLAEMLGEAGARTRQRYEDLVLQSGG